MVPIPKWIPQISKHLGGLMSVTLHGLLEKLVASFNSSLMSKGEMAWRVFLYFIGADFLVTLQGARVIS
jgi:hypothetical protein